MTKVKDNLLIVLFSAPHGTITSAQLKWSLRHVLGLQRIEVVSGKPGCDMLANRNRIIRDVVLKAEQAVTEFVCIEHDMTPLLESDVIFDVKADVVGCQYETHNKNSWIVPDIFHTGFFRAQRRVFDPKQGGIVSPWHRQPYTADGCDLDGCECLDLCRRIRSAGFSIAHAGRAEHRGDASWMH